MAHVEPGQVKAVSFVGSRLIERKLLLIVIVPEEHLLIDLAHELGDRRVAAAPIACSDFISILWGYGGPLAVPLQAEF